MIERDYILRMIQMLSAFLAKVLLQKDLKQFDDALLEIDENGEKFLGAKWKVIRDLPEEQLIALFGYEYHLPKMLAAAEFLRMESDILNEQGKPDESAVQGMKAFSLFVELIAREKSFLNSMPVAEYDRLLHRLEGYELPPTLQRKQFTYYEKMGQFARAENVLFDILENDHPFVVEGVAFYRRLEKKTDEELQSGGLPREEVIEGLKKMEDLAEG